MAHPSVFGYKNPMALALLGQLFLLAERATSPDQDRKWRGVWCTLLAAEILYLATLRSRTALVAAGVGLIALGVFGLVARRPGGRRTALVAFASVAALIVLLVALPGARARMGTLGPLLASPSKILETDRGTYFRNTLGMVSDHPFGVGLGDWQTYYPVYRAHDRGRSFDDRFQVRRAHSDHVQMLGELGWPGLALWGCLLGAAALLPLFAARRSGARRGLFLAAQVIALAVAMGTDYFVDTPYGKFQLFLVLALVTLGAHRGAEDEPPEAAERGPGTLAAIGVTVIALLGLAFGSFALARGIESAHLRAAHRRLLDPELTHLDRAAHAALLLERRSARYHRLPLSSRTSFKDHLLLAHAEQLAGRADRATAEARHSLALHPYYPNAFRFLAGILQNRQPELADSYAETYRYLMDEATHGFDRAYPEMDPTGPSVAP